MSDELLSIKAVCFEKIEYYKKRYKRLKLIDDILDGTSTVCSASGLALLVLGISNPVLLIASGICSGFSFVLTQVQNKMDLKNKYNHHDNTVKQYSEIVREISTILLRNHLTKTQYLEYLQHINDKISLIEDNSIL